MGDHLRTSKVCEVWEKVKDFFYFTISILHISKRKQKREKTRKKKMRLKRNKEIKKRKKEWSSRHADSMDSFDSLSTPIPISHHFWWWQLDGWVEGCRIHQLHLCSYWKRSLWVTLDYSRPSYICQWLHNNSKGGALDKMVIIIGNKHDGPSLNPRWGCFSLCANVLGKDINPSVLSSIYI